MPDSTSVANCYAIAEKYRMLERFPDSVRELFQHHALEETPKSDDLAFHRARWWPLLSNATLLEAAEVEAQRHGFSVEIDNSCDDWDYQRAAEYLLNRLRQLHQKSERVCLISGGEVTVKVKNGGTGGRNQQFALACASRISGEAITILSAGTDGIDGNSPTAGAIVDGSTLERAKARALDPAAHLASFDAYPFFESLGDAIITGPTGKICATCESCSRIRFSTAAVPAAVRLASRHRVSGKGEQPGIRLFKKPGHTFFHHEHAVFNARCLGFFLQQAQRFVHGFVREAKSAVMHGHHPTRIQIEEGPRCIGRAGVDVPEGWRIVGPDWQQRHFRRQTVSDLAEAGEVGGVAGVVKRVLVVA